MRLISARVCGLGRLVDTEVNLDSKVIAVVGPNEAGKSTLLPEPEYLSPDQDSIPESERSRAVDVNDETQTIRADFALDEEDISALGDLDLLQQPTRVAFARRARGGPVLVDITPRWQGVGTAAVPGHRVCMCTGRNRGVRRQIPDRWRTEPARKRRRPPGRSLGAFAQTCARRSAL
jgi:hypothetical protein